MKQRFRELCARAAQECTANNLRRASRQVSAAFDEALEGSGLRGTQFTLLTALAVGGELPLTRLAEVLSLDRTTLTRNLLPLQRDGLVESRATADARVRKVALTERGQQTLERALPRWEAAQKSVIQALGEGQWKELMSILKGI
jgi:DNA-binding MarR family transcriptional regulator